MKELKAKEVMQLAVSHDCGAAVAIVSVVVQPLHRCSLAALVHRALKVGLCVLFVGLRLDPEVITTELHPCPFKVSR